VKEKLVKKLAIALSALLLGGCIFLTPPTGLRVGDHSQEFANLQQQTTAIDPAKLEYTTYEGPDFAVTYPKDWGEGRASTDFSQGSTTRFSSGARYANGDSEGLVITTINAFPGTPWKNEELAGFVKTNLAQGTQAFEVLGEKTDDTLGGETATRLECKATDAKGGVSHMLAYSLMHEGRGWVFVISTLEGRYAALSPVFEQLVKSVKWKTGTAASAAPTTLPSGTTAPGQVPASPVSGSPAAPVSPTPTPSGAPNVAPPSPTPPAPGATQPPSPSPAP
jgi:hypothetical protein